MRLRSYLWGARHRDDLVRRDRAVDGTTLNETRYVLMDYFNPSAITDETGEVTERYAFSAFGVRSILNRDYTPRTTSESAFEFAFQGQFLDTESGLYNYGFRYYSPYLGRWTCKDPIGEVGGFNLYACVDNGPVNVLDYLGLVDSCCKDKKPPQRDDGGKLCCSDGMTTDKATGKRSCDKPTDEKGNPLNGADKAALDRLQQIGKEGDELKGGKEIAGLIVKGADGKMSAANEHQTTANKEGTPDAGYKGEFEGWYHTHGQGGPENNSFSIADQSYTEHYKDPGYASFPNGSIGKTSPSNNTSGPYPGTMAPTIIGYWR